MISAEKQQEFRVFSEQDTCAAMLMAGIGTGGFSIGSRGELRDWEIFNHPDKGNRFPYTFFSIHAENSQVNITKVLEAAPPPPYEEAQGFVSNTVTGLPRFQSSSMEVEFPFVSVRLKQPDLPFFVVQESYNPFIPLNAEDSGIPAAMLQYRVTNTGDETLRVSIAGSLFNASGFTGLDIWGNAKNVGHPENQWRKRRDICGIFFDNSTLDKKDFRYGNLALTALSEKGISAKTSWNMGQRNDGVHDFWDDFSKDGQLNPAPAELGTAAHFDSFVKAKIGSLSLTKEIPSGETASFSFMISWCFPNRLKAWPADENLCKEEKSTECTKNYYAVRFKDAMQAAVYFWKERGRLEKESRLFSNALYSSTLPAYVIEAVAGNLATLKSTTCFRIENGHMFAFEGCLDHVGSCPGNCTHVWYYAQAMAYLFPELEQSMRRTDFLVETDDRGCMQFRAMTELNGEGWGFLPAVDGQMGTIVRLYRDWLISGNDAFLKELFPAALRAMEFGIAQWDTDGDFVLDGMMHVDYDVEFYGPNPLGNFCYLAALKSMVAMADYLKEDAAKQRYQEIFLIASVRVDGLLWNGSFYEQKLTDVNQYKYQYGKCCLSDQLIGQFLAGLTGLGYLADEAHIRQAALSIYRYNFKTDFTDHPNVQRSYALGKEEGLLMTTWPFGGRPDFPFFYSDEVWGRTEYHVASLLIQLNYLEQGLHMVQAVQNRYDGRKRNPFNEFECGYHYAGNMASYALLVALSGFSVNRSKGEMSFDPKINKDDFQCFWCHGDAWGVYRQKSTPSGKKETVDILYQREIGKAVGKA